MYILPLIIGNISNISVILCVMDALFALWFPWQHTPCAMVTMCSRPCPLFRDGYGPI